MAQKKLGLKGPTSESLPLVDMVVSGHYPWVTSLPVRYMEIREPDENGWFTVGALWISEDGAMSVSYVPGREAWATAYNTMLRAAFEAGTPATEFFDYWNERGGNGMGFEFGDVEEADSLDDLRRRLERKA